MEILRFPGFPTIFPLKRPFWDSYNLFYLFLEGPNGSYPFSRQFLESLRTPYQKGMNPQTALTSLGP